MATDDKTSLTAMREPENVEIVPGLILQDKLRVATQCKLEEYFKLPIHKIFGDKSEAVDFTSISNMIPLLLIMGQQANPELTRTELETILDEWMERPEFTDGLEKFFQKFSEHAAKNSQKPAKKRAKTPVRNVT